MDNENKNIGSIKENQEINAEDLEESKAVKKVALSDIAGTSESSGTASADQTNVASDASVGKHADAATAEPIYKKKSFIAAIIIAVVVICIASVAVFALTTPKTSVSSAITESSDFDFTEATKMLAENPIDWDEAMEINDNIYAWIRFPNTNVDLPILQHPLADNYYLAHDMYGNDTIMGAIYSQGKYNTKDFTEDPVTVLYGHTFQTEDTMFSTLHNLEDPEFFEENPYFFIYTPNSILKYKVISAYEGDNKLILAKWDVANLEKQQEYFDFVTNPESWNQNIREMDPLVAGEDHIVQLSTCTKPSDANKRYLVTGVLMDVEETE